MNRYRLLAAAAFASAAAWAFVSACGSSTPSPIVSPGGYAISISNLSFSPLNLEAPPGATVTVTNNDNTPHSVTSEAAAGNFVPGAVSGVQFDTSPFVGQASFMIPGNAPNGTVIPYYCRVHLSGMNTPTGTITIKVSAAHDGGTPDGGQYDGGEYDGGTTYGTPYGGAGPDGGTMDGGPRP